MGVLGPDGVPMDDVPQPMQAAAFEIPPVKLADGTVLMCRVGSMEGQGWTFFPDKGLTLIPGYFAAPLIYYTMTMRVRNRPQDVLFCAEDFRAIGTPIQMMIVEEPAWWTKRVKEAHRCAPSEADLEG